MQIAHRTLVVAVAVLGSATLARAQDGHWQGAIKLPNQEIAIEVDLAKKSGATIGTFTGVNIKGYPLSEITLDGTAITFALKVDGGGAFSGKLSADGQSLSGEFTANAGAYVLPFTLARRGDAQFEAPAKNPRIGKELEGTWTGTLEANGTSMRVVFKMANQADGTATGSIANLDQGAVEIPISTISQSAEGVKIGVTVVSGSYAGTLNAAGTELTGMWSQGSFSAPLTLKRNR